MNRNEIPAANWTRRDGHYEIVTNKGRREKRNNELVGNGKDSE